MSPTSKASVGTYNCPDNILSFSALIDTRGIPAGESTSKHSIFPMTRCTNVNHAHPSRVGAVWIMLSFADKLEGTKSGPEAGDRQTNKGDSSTFHSSSTLRGGGGMQRRKKLGLGTLKLLPLWGGESRGEILTCLS